MATASTVFISYAHTTRALRDRVWALADTLSTLGLNVIFDLYVPNPTEGWTQWMHDGVKKADFIVAVCDEAYCQRLDGDQLPGTGLGAQWEGKVLYNLLQSEPSVSSKVQVVQLERFEVPSIPLPIRSNNRFVLNSFDLSDEQFEDLYRVLTLQPRAVRPEIGEIVELPPSSPASLQVLPETPAPASNIRRAQSLKAAPIGGAEAGQDRIRGERSFSVPRGNTSFARRKALTELASSINAVKDGDFESALAHAVKGQKWGCQLNRNVPRAPRRRASEHASI